MLLNLKAWLKNFWSFLLNDRGIVEGEEGAEGAEAATENAEGTGDGSENAEGTGEEGGEGFLAEGAEGASEPGTGEEADNVDEELKKLFGGDFNKLGKSYRELQSKHKPIEMNVAAIKKWAEDKGLKIVVDARGNFKAFEVDTAKAKPKELQRAFTDEHTKQFDSFFNIDKNPKAGEQFRELMKLYFQDLLGDAFSERDTRMMQAAEFRKHERETEKFIARVYPEADPDNPDFPEGGTPLYNRATEIYEANEAYQQHPKGQLFAVHEAAIELGVKPAALTAARQAGKKEGLESKRILGKIGSAGAGKGTEAVRKTGEVSLADFMAMTPEKRKEYQEGQLKKKTGG